MTPRFTIDHLRDSQVVGTWLFARGATPVDQFGGRSPPVIASREDSGQIVVVNIIRRGADYWTISFE
jgi:hypothetical protein